MSVKPAVRKAGPMASVTAAAGPVAPSKAPSSKAPGVSEHQQQQQQEQQQPSTGPLSIRVTPSGKLYTYVRHALDHLSEHPDRPVELHTRLPIPDEEASSARTLPPIVIPPTTASRNQNLTKTKTNGPAPAPAAVALEHTRSLLPCTTSIPRLITVLEITKREYLREKSKEGRGLWQYSRFGGYSREEVGKWETQQRERRMAGAAVAGMGKGKGRGRSGKEKGEPEETREDGMDVDVSLKEPATGGAKANESAPPEGIIQSDAPTHPYADADEGQKGQEKEDRFLRDLLEGGPNHIKMTHTPYMSVILSTRPLPHLLQDPEISYQPVKPLGRRKARRVRAKEKAMTVATTEEEGGERPGKKARVGETREEEEEEEEEVEVVEGSSEEEEGETMEV